MSTQTLEAKIAELSISDKNITKSIFKSCSAETLHKIWAADNKELEDIRLAKNGRLPQKDKLIDALMLGVNNTAALCLIERIRKEVLTRLCEPVPIVHKINYTNKDGSKKAVPLLVLQKRLREILTVTSPVSTKHFNTENKDPNAVKTYSLGEFFDKFHAKNTELLTELCEVFDIEVPKDAKNAQLRAAVVDGLLLSGLWTFLGSLNIETLRQVAKENGIRKSKEVASKSRLINALLTGELPDAKEDNRPRNAEEVGPKVTISKCDKYQLQQHYYISELIDYCHEHQIKASGSKKELIDRIVAWGKADANGKGKYESTTPYEPRKKSSKSKKSSSDKKSSSKKSKKESSESSESSEEEVADKKSKKSESGKKSSSDKKSSSKDKKKEADKDAVEEDDKPEKDTKKSSSDKKSSSKDKKKEADNDAVEEDDKPEKDTKKSSSKDKKKEADKDAVEEDDKPEKKSGKTKEAPAAEPAETPKAAEAPKAAVPAAADPSEDLPAEEEEEEEENADEISDFANNPESKTIQELAEFCRKFTIDLPEKDKLKKADYVAAINNTVLLLDGEDLKKYDVEVLRKYALASKYGTESELKEMSKNKLAKLISDKSD